MKIEKEVKFLNIKKKEIREKLKNIGAKCIRSESMMKRVVYDLGPRRYVRIRDEGDKITFTYKELSSGKLNIDSVKEIETIVGDFEKMVSILEKMGHKIKSYQETKREIWEINGVEFMIDTWPWLNTFLEIEAGSEEEIKKYSQLLGFDYKDAVFGAVDEIAKIELGVTSEFINNVPKISFDTKLEEYL